MTAADHEQLLGTLATIEGRFILSSYPSELYDDHARRHGWRRVDIPIDNKASGAKRKQKKTECLWRNFK